MKDTKMKAVKSRYAKGEVIMSGDYDSVLNCEIDGDVHVSGKDSMVNANIIHGDLILGAGVKQRGNTVQGKIIDNRIEAKYNIRLLNSAMMEVDVPIGGLIRMGRERGVLSDDTPLSTIKVFGAECHKIPIMVFNNVSYFRKV